MSEAADLVVVGSGQGGLPLARAFASEGKRVVLFERDRIGGSCVNYGCTPSKAFLASAHAAGRARAAADLHVATTVVPDVPAIMARVRAVRDEWHAAAEAHVAQSGIDVVCATGTFSGIRTVRGGGREVTAPLVVVDTGTSPTCPPIAGLAATPYLTNRTWFDQTALPRRLIVIGGGYIGLELGQGARRLGADVTIVHGAAHVMEREEPDATDVVRAALERDGVRLELGARAEGAEYRDGIFRLTLAGGAVLEAECVLVAAGRAANTPDLNAAASNVELDEHGYVRVDDYLQTTCPGVYAIGDVAGQPNFTHVSWEDFRRLRSTFAGRPRRRDDRVLSYATFTEPQLARTGLTEAQARALGHAVRVRTLPLADTARGGEWRLDAGFFRLVVDVTTDAILGATFVGYEAGELVHTIAFGIELGATWRQLDDLVGIHPTFGEALPSLARLFASSEA